MDSVPVNRCIFSHKTVFHIDNYSVTFANLNSKFYMKTICNNNIPVRMNCKIKKYVLVLKVLAASY